MAQTKIEWTGTKLPDGTIVPGYTFNPWIGCTKVSQGCKNCYAETWAERYPKWRDTWGPEGTRLRTSPANWKKPLVWDAQAKAEGIRRKVFCASLADVFEDRPELAEWRKRLFLDLIDKTPNLNWLLLTKRPENVNRMVADIYGDCAALGWYDTRPREENIWIGTSVENQEQANKRIPELLTVWSENVIKFLSCEPLLGPVNLGILEDPYNFDRRFPGKHHEYSALDPDPEGGCLWYKGEPLGTVDWVIVGGESGPNKRPMELSWARAIRDQCKIDRVPFFFKQVDKVQPIPEDLMIREFPE